ncbi:CapA family protein [Chelativorans sp. AA-79]|uniref:CapA family protein n=1 Tax=Chelativorans sp. AA-79 TaxID=3028735 RepID=UPI0023F8CFA9|nr:CapA family protein [Chelativorans sp. AA-79]WEX10771.1 CapA family protein [Chelativorans sp. AA-79]
MGFVGDINLLDFPTDRNPFHRMMPYLSQLDLSAGTLEGLLSRPEELFYKPGFTHVGEGHAPNLAEAGFKALNLASNVTYGREAIERTLEQLDRAGIGHAGAGLDRRQARQPMIIEAGGLKIGMISRTSVFWPNGHEALDHQAGVIPLRVTTFYQPHPRLIELPGAPAIVHTNPNEQELAELVADVNELRGKVDLLFTYFHFGVSSQRDVAQYQRTVARAVVDAGADAVFGSHAHVVQPIEVYKGKPLFYGLSQVIFGWPFVARLKHPGGPGLIVELEIRGGERRWTARFVKPDVETLEPYIAPFSDVPEEIAHLEKTSAETITFRDDHFVINT